jgi:D-alanyl-D-alanine carboxypeptidase/D-alanyl-D-alanine-endopeptidase (penicillin-binding protein 4)
MWADSLVVRGIDEIDGNIVVDNSLFVGAELGPGWSWDDLTYWYACPISALSFNDNCVDLKFLPGQKPGDPAHIECDPNTDYIITHNNAYTLPAESSLTLDYYRTPNTNEITFFGGIPASDTAGEIDYVSVHRPAMYAAHVFADILAARDVRLKGALVLLDEMPGSEKQKYSRLNLSPLFDWQSDTLGVVLKVINTNSQNFFAEQTLKMLGASFESEGSFKGGVRAARRVFEKFGIDSTQLMMMDGSGLSYINAVTPRAITRLLERMAARPNFGLYYESLGNPAKDRSVRKRLVDVPNRENVRAKTGNIAGASTFSGYVLGPRTNHMIAFSVMVNHFTCHRTYVEDWEDAIIAELLRSY